MAETSVNENKPSVVDDFFSALFANNATVSNDTDVNTSSMDDTSTTLDKFEENTIEAATKSSLKSSEETRNSDEVLDEFDEYSLLSSRKQTDEGEQTSIKFPGESPAQILAKRDIDWSTVTPESRMLIRQLPQSVDKQAIMDYFSKYGEVIEVVQKNSFGFVHFEKPEDCARAVRTENGKYYHGVLLDLEICKRKPFFARVLDGKTTQRRDVSPPPRRRRSRSPSRSHSPTRQRRRRNSPPRNNNTDIRRGPRNRPNDYNNTMNDNSRYDYSRGYNNRRPNEYNQQPYNGYNNHRQATSVLPPRSGQNIPAVQIVSWSNIHRNFVSHVEGVFAHHSIRTATAVVQFSQSSREEIIKQLVLEGVKALIIVDNVNEPKHKVYLQVFSANETGEGVRYDEYDSVTPNEAVTIIKSLNSPIVQQGYNGQYNSSANQYNPPQPQYNSLAYNQQQQQYNPLQPQYTPQQYNQSPQYARSQPQPAASAALDSNTLNVLYSLLQKNTAAPVVQTPAFPSAPAVSQPSIPQLIATLISGLNMNKGSSSPQIQVNLPQQTSAPPPSYPPTNVVPVSKPAVDQPSIAALLSTASNGNPALAQLLHQMTASVTNTAPPPQPSASATNQSKSEYTPSI